MASPDDPARSAVPPPVGAPPPSPSFLIMNLGRRLREGIEQALAARGMALRHLSALGHLSREPGLSYSELARRAGVTPQSMQATLRQLETLGAVERRTEPGRGRTAQLHVTEVGVALRDDGRRVLSDADRHLLADIPAEQHGVLLQALLLAFSSASAASSADGGQRRAEP